MFGEVTRFLKTWNMLPYLKYVCRKDFSKQEIFLNIYKEVMLLKIFF